MSTPAGELYVDRERLRRQAHEWEARSRALEAVSNQAMGMRVTIDGGRPFHDVIAAYNAAAEEVGTLTDQGGDVMLKISTALHEAVSTYDDADEWFKKYFPGPTLF